MGKKKVKRKSKKHKLLGLLGVGVFVMAIGIFGKDWNSNKVVSNRQMEAYGRTFLRRYEKLVKSKVLPAYKKYFSFLKEKSILIDVSISTTHGAAVEFIPSEVRKFQCRTVTDRIEHAVFPNIDLNIFKIEGDTNNASVMIYSDEPGPICEFTGKFGGLKNLVFVTNKGWLLELLETGSVRTEEIVVDNIDYPNTIIIKGSNRRNDWSRKTAKEEALYDFRGDFISAYLNSEEFREFVATPELTQISNGIKAKHEAGDYGGEYGYLECEEDLAELNAVADAHNISHEFATNLYEFVKEQPLWRERHSVMFNVMCGIGVGFLVLLLIWLLKWGWKWICVKLVH